jgi:hypothetical protein|tara:strand:- start:198 stop:554 length:357 start_codon:yes stop_codon:yes gene_type:complete
MGRKRSKFSVCPKEQRTHGDIVFDSKKEMKRYLTLLEMVKDGEIHLLERQPRFGWTTTYSHGDRSLTKNSYHYRADFQYVICETGECVVEDVKGYKTPEYKRKKEIVESLYNIEIKET